MSKELAERLRKFIGGELGNRAADALESLEAARMAAISRLCEAEVSCATACQERNALIASLKEIDEAVVEQVDLFGQRGEVCSFEGNSMIYAETLMELGDKVTSVVERHSKDAGADKEARVDQTPTVEDINLQNWNGMDGACAWHLIDRHAEDWHHTARLMDAWLEANREDLVAQLATAMRDAGEFAHQSMKAQDELKALREQEPVGYIHPRTYRWFAAHKASPSSYAETRIYCSETDSHAVPLYAHPVPAKKLTDEEILNALDAKVRTRFGLTRKEWFTAGSVDVREFVRAIEAAMRGEGHV